MFEQETRFIIILSPAFAQEQLNDRLRFLTAITETDRQLYKRIHAHFQAIRATIGEKVKAGQVEGRSISSERTLRRNGNG